MCASAPLISAVIPLRDKEPVLRRCLEALVRSASRHGRTELILVDNGSTDGSAEIAVSFVPDVAVYSDLSPTIAGVRNFGSTVARGSILCFIDADCVVPEHYFDRVEQAFQNPQLTVAGCQVAYPSTTWIERTWGNLHRQRTAGARLYINSGNLAVRREFFCKIGGFDPSLTTGEDAEFGLRTIRAGAFSVELPELEVLHVDNPTSLSSFFMKELWHAHGMLDTATLRPLDRPLALTVAHLLLLGTSLLVWLEGSLPPTIRVLALSVGVLLVPAAAVVYRQRKARNRPRWIPALALYEAYFLARSLALLAAVWRRVIGASRQAIRAAGGRKSPGAS